jgi:hypothetical protein
MKRLTWQSVLPLGLAVLLAWAGSPMAAERLTIEQLYQYHASYHLHSVIVGKVEAMQALPPTPVRTRRCNILSVRHCKFVLVDDTGSLPVENLGSCFATAMKLPQDSDLIELTAKIHVFVPNGHAAQVIEAFTQEIVIVE